MRGLFVQQDQAFPSSLLTVRQTGAPLSRLRPVHERLGLVTMKCQQNLIKGVKTPTNKITEPIIPNACLFISLREYPSFTPQASHPMAPRYSRAAFGGVGCSERLAYRISITRRNVRIHRDYQSKTASPYHLQEHPKRDIHA